MVFAAGAPSGCEYHGEPGMKKQRYIAWGTARSPETNRVVRCHVTPDGTAHHADGSRCDWRKVRWVKVRTGKDYPPLDKA